MWVWINSSDGGWVQHGRERSSAERAAAVAQLLNRRLGWETAAGPVAPESRPASAGAPTAAVAAVSPANFDDPNAPRPERRKQPATGRDDAPLPAGDVPDAVTAAAQAEPYLAELVSFALEGQLRDFMIANLSRILVAGTRLRLYKDSSGRSGREYPTAVGPIDILAVDDAGNLFVFELKLERGPDRVLGQLARYMGWVKANLAQGTEVRGVAVARTIDEKLRYAAAVLPDVLLLEYEIDFQLREVPPMRPPEP